MDITSWNSDIWTARLCKSTIYVTILLSMASMGFSFVQFRWGQLTSHTESIGTGGGSLRQIGAEMLPLAMNALVTLLTRGLGLIHTTTLRYNLFDEDRLTFNSNLRLFTSAKHHWPNQRMANGLNCICLVFAFACTSMVFPGVASRTPMRPYSDNRSYYGYIMYNPVAIYILGQCGLLQAFLAKWSLSRTKISSWSSNAIATVLKHAEEEAGDDTDDDEDTDEEAFLRRRVGRCMMGVERTELPTRPTPPVRRQVSPWKAHRQVRIIVAFVWSTTLLCCLWALLTLVLIPKTRKTSTRYWGPSWAFLPNNSSPILGIRHFSHLKSTSTVGLFILALIYASIQAVFTLGLHTAELVVNLSRDEDNWRLCTSPSGCNFNSNPILAAAKSWKAMFLFGLTPVVHWVFGLSIQLYGNYGLFIRPVQIFYLALLMALLATFVTYLSFKRPKGPQPATYGHFQTLMDLIDENVSNKDRMFWGHKYIDEDTQAAHAGVSKVALDPIMFNRLYA